MDAKISSPFTLEDQSQAIAWKQLLSLVALYSSVIIGWIAYYNYQPKLLEEYSFKSFSFFLTVVQAIVVVVTPPIAGKFGDRYRFKKGHQLPIVSTGISFVAMVFMAVAFTLFSNPGEILRWILPGLIVLWLIGMSIFTSPALSTLELFTPVDKIPKAMAVLTIASNLIYAIEPVIVDLIDVLGAPLTFVTGGLIIFLSGLLLKKNSLTLFSSQRRPAVREVDKRMNSDYMLIVMFGCAVGVITTLLFNFIPTQLQGSFQVITNIGWQPKWILFFLLIVSALVSLPLSDWINRWGLYRSFVIGILISLFCGAVIFLSPVPVVSLFFALLFVVGFTILSVASLPLAIERSGYYEKVFCVGLFFSGVALPDGIVTSLLSY